MSFVDACVDTLLPLLTPGDVVVGKSTVPVGTAEVLAARIQDAQPAAELIWNPEFLREGLAIQDTLRPDRIVYGLTDSSRAHLAAQRLDEVYAVALADGVPKIETDLATAQLVKVAANSFLATKISFINAMAELCEASGADVTVLADAIGHDGRIGRRFLNAGLGFGGGCLPKDIRAFMARAEELGVTRPSASWARSTRSTLTGGTRMVELAAEQARRIARRATRLRPRGCVQARQRRRPGLPGTDRGRDDACAGGERRRDGPSGDPQRRTSRTLSDLSHDRGRGGGRK